MGILVCASSGVRSQSGGEGAFVSRLEPLFKWQIMVALRATNCHFLSYDQTYQFPSPPTILVRSTSNYFRKQLQIDIQQQQYIHIYNSSIPGMIVRCTINIILFILLLDTYIFTHFSLVKRPMKLACSCHRQVVVTVSFVVYVTQRDLIAGTTTVNTMWSRRLIPGPIVLQV